MTAVPQLTAEQVIELAATHVGNGSMASSAQLCLDDARACLANGSPEYARKRALSSLAYSLGMLSPVYKLANGGRVYVKDVQGRPIDGGTLRTISAYGSFSLNLFFSECGTLVAMPHENHGHEAFQA